MIWTTYIPSATAIMASVGFLIAVTARIVRKKSTKAESDYIYPTLAPPSQELKSPSTPDLTDADIGWSVGPQRAKDARESLNAGPAVFLCHSSGDKEAVRNLYRRLLDDGVRCWFDEENLMPGQDWEYEITRAIRQSRYVLACLSQSSITKTGYVQKELKKALDIADEQPEGVAYLIPVRLEECEIPERLRKWHWVDLFKDDGYAKLKRSLQTTTAPGPGRIFLCYRRADKPDMVGRIYNRIAGSLGGRAQIIMDFNSPATSIADFRASLEDIVSTCRVMVILIGEDWLNVPGAYGGRRLDDPDDSVRIEIETALKCGIAIMPILLGDTDSPMRDELPASIALLSRFNHLNLEHAHFDQDSDRLIRFLERMTES